MLIDFSLTLLNLCETHLQVQAAPRIEVTICFFYGAPLVEFAESKVWVLVFHHL